MCVCVYIYIYRNNGASMCVKRGDSCLLLCLLFTAMPSLHKITSSSKITVNGDRSHEIKRCFLLGKKAMTNLDSVLNSRDITLPARVCVVEAMAFPLVMYTCESWTIKKAEH